MADLLDDVFAVLPEEVEEPAEDEDTFIDDEETEALAERPRRNRTMAPMITGDQGRDHRPAERGQVDAAERAHG